MTKQEEQKKPSEILPFQMTYNTKFQFKCHKGLDCFTKCCRGIEIMLTPYDILTLKNRLELTSEEFLAIYTEPKLLEKGDLPIVLLKQLDDERKSCPFVDDEKGCVIYEDRPTTCRYYPLGVGSLSYSKETGKKDEFFFTIKESHCLGFEENKVWTVAEWRGDQGVDLRDDVNAGWTDLIVRKKTLPANIKLTEKAKEMFFMTCYNIDAFKRFVFESSFLQRYNLSSEQIDAIKDDEVKLLQFGFEWLKSLLFKGEIDPQKAKS